MLSKGTKFFDTHKSFPFTFLTEPATTTIYWTLSIRKQSTYVARKKTGILEKTKDSGEVPEAGAVILVAIVRCCYLFNLLYSRRLSGCSAG